jgi:antitoxin YefM
MITGSKHNAVVGKHGKIEILRSELPEGAQVEVIVLLASQDADEMPTIAHPELLAAIDRVEQRQGLVTFTPDAWKVKSHRHR